MTLKDTVKGMLGNFASPAPFLVRNNWGPVADFGASKPALANVARGYYGNALYNLLDNMNMVQHPQLWQALNEAKNRNEYYMLQNYMRYNPNFLDGMQD